VHALELVDWALQGAGEEVLPVLQQLAWQAEQLLEARLPRSTWLGARPSCGPPAQCGPAPALRAPCAPCCTR
jgi:hypothetical protein